MAHDVLIAAAPLHFAIQRKPGGLQGVLDGGLHRREEAALRSLARDGFGNNDAEVSILGHALDHAMGLGEGGPSAKDDLGARRGSDATDRIHGVADQGVFFQHRAA